MKIYFNIAILMITFGRAGIIFFFYSSYLCGLERAHEWHHALKKK